jgi:hypothetical protein
MGELFGELRFRKVEFEPPPPHFSNDHAQFLNSGFYLSTNMGESYIRFKGRELRQI